VALGFAMHRETVSARGQAEPQRRYWLALVLGALLHAGVLSLGDGGRRVSALAVRAAEPARAELDIEELVAASSRGGTPGASHLSAPESERKLGTVSEVLKVKNSTLRPKLAKPALGNTEGQTAADRQLESPDLFGLDQVLSAEAEAGSVQAVRAAPVRTRVLSVPPSDVSSGAAPRGFAGDNAAVNHAQGKGFSGRGGGPGSGSKDRAVAPAFPFGGSKGAFLAQVCFIPKGTLSVASVGACAVELEFRSDSINVTPQHFNEGFPGIPDRTEWFAILFTGGFRVKQAGLYHFRVVSDDGSYLELDGRRVIDNDGIHGPTSKGVSIHLEAGRHAFGLHYFQGPRDLVAVQLFVTPPGGQERLLRENL